jgi:hypothetical protein
MQIHIHLGYNVMIGKTLSMLLSFACLNRTNGTNVLIMDMDNYGFKVHGLLAPLKSEMDIGFRNSQTNQYYTLYHIRNSNTYVASWPLATSIGGFFENLTYAIDDISNQLKAFHEGSGVEFTGFNHVLVDTSTTILQYEELSAAPMLPDGLERVKFWINHDSTQYTDQTTPGRFWRAHTAIRRYFPATCIVPERPHPDKEDNCFIYVFNPAGFLTANEIKGNNGHLMGLFSRGTMYSKLVDKAHTSNLWCPPEITVRRPITVNSEQSFDQRLGEIIGQFNDSRGNAVAKWWSAKFSGDKPRNTVFLPVEDDLDNYREVWAVSKPLTSLQDFRNRLGDVSTNESVRKQWTELILR